MYNSATLSPSQLVWCRGNIKGFEQFEKESESIREDSKRMKLAAGLIKESESEGVN